MQHVVTTLQLSQRSKTQTQEKVKQVIDTGQVMT